MAIEYLTQDQIDKIILEGAKIDDVTGENDDKKGAQETRPESLMIKKRKAARRYPERKSLLHNSSEGHGVVIIGGDNTGKERDYIGVNGNENNLPRSPLMEYALFTFDLKREGIIESANSLFGSLIKRLLDTDYSWLASPHTQNLLVARFNGKEGLLNGVYRAVQSRYKVYGSYIYETKLVFSGSADDEKRFASGLEHEVRSYSDHCPGVIYVQKELRVPLGNYLDDSGIGITAECDLGSFPREETRRK